MAERLCKCGYFQKFAGKFTGKKCSCFDNADNTTKPTTTLQDEQKLPDSIHQAVSTPSTSAAINEHVGCHRFVFIHAMPFRPDLKAFDALREERLIKDAMIKTSIDINFESIVGSNNNIYSISDRKPTILHFTGHGLKDNSRGVCALVTEGDSGSVTYLSTNEIKLIFQKSSLILAVLACCHSVEIGEVLRQCGVKYVVAFAGEVETRRAERFVDMFYDRLFSGEGVRRSFDLAASYQDVETITNLPGANNFIFLANEDDSDNVLFKQDQRGTLNDSTIRHCSIMYNCESLPERPIIRSEYINKVYLKYLSGYRVVTISGERGSGSSVAAQMACRHLYLRPLFSAIIRVKLYRRPLKPLNSHGISGKGTNGEGKTVGTTAVAEKSDDSNDSSKSDNEQRDEEAIEILYKELCKAFKMPRQNHKVSLVSLSCLLSDIRVKLNGGKLLLFLDNCDRFLSKRDRQDMIKSPSESHLSAKMPAAAGAGSSRIATFSTNPSSNSSRHSFDNASTFSNMNAILPSKSSPVLSTIEQISKSTRGPLTERSFSVDDLSLSQNLSPSAGANQPTNAVSETNSLHRIVRYLHRECGFVSFLICHSDDYKLVASNDLTNVEFTEHRVNVEGLREADARMLINRFLIAQNATMEHLIPAESGSSAFMTPEVLQILGQNPKAINHFFTHNVFEKFDIAPSNLVDLAKVSRIFAAHHGDDPDNEGSESDDICQQNPQPQTQSQSQLTSQSTIPVVTTVVEAVSAADGRNDMAYAVAVAVPVGETPESVSESESDARLRAKEQAEKSSRGGSSERQSNSTHSMSTVTSNYPSRPIDRMMKNRSNEARIIENQTANVGSANYSSRSIGSTDGGSNDSSRSVGSTGPSTRPSRTNHTLAATSTKLSVADPPASRPNRSSSSDTAVVSEASKKHEETEDPYVAIHTVLDDDDDVYISIQKYFDLNGAPNQPKVFSQRVPFQIVIQVITEILARRYTRHLDERDMDFILAIAAQPRGIQCSACDLAARQICNSSMQTLRTWWYDVHQILDSFAGEFNNSTVHGFVTRDQVLSMLKSCSDGTYIIRFSERKSGTLTASYKLDGKINHTTIRIESNEFILTGNERRFRTLTDLIQNFPTIFRTLYSSQRDSVGDSS